jgi:hypothetical protein
MAHKIGTKVWHKGDEVTIITDSYILHGGAFQDALTENGDVVTIATPEQQLANAQRFRADWAEQQSQFRALSKQQ